MRRVKRWGLLHEKTSPLLPGRLVERLAQRQGRWSKKKPASLSLSIVRNMPSRLRLGRSQHFFKRLGLYRTGQTLAIFENDGGRAIDFVLLAKRQVAVDHLCIALRFWRWHIVDHPVVPDFVAILRTPDVLRFGRGIRPQIGYRKV